MKLLFRYVLTEFIVPFFYCLTGFTAVYVFFEMSGSFSRLLDAKLPATAVVSYFLGYLSPFVIYLFPAALMLATLYTMWNLCRHGEVVAMRSNGVSFAAISAPILAVAALSAAFVAWVDECYVPAHAQWAKILRNEKFDLKEADRVDNLVFRNPRDRRVWTVDGVQTLPGGTFRFKDVKVTLDRADGTRESTIRAAAAEYLDGEWWFSNTDVVHHGVGLAEAVSKTPELDALKFRVFPEFRERPTDILMQNRDLKFSSVRDKLRFMRVSKGEMPEQRRRECQFEAFAQALAPLACIVMTLFSIPAGIASSRQSVFKGIVGAVGMFFAFYALAMLVRVLPEIADFPVWYAAALPYAVFLALGWWLFRRHR